MATLNWKKISETSGIQTEEIVIRLYDTGNGNREYEVTKKRDNVIVFAITENKKILVLEQFRPGPDRVLIDLPSGGIEEGEDAIAAGKREMLEETGYSSDDIMLLGSSMIKPRSTNSYYYVLAQNCIKMQEPREGEIQIGNILEYSIEECKAYLKSGDLTAADMCGGYMGLIYAMEYGLLEE